MRAAYLDILKEELVPAMGCTEPVAVAYAAARARDALGQMPDRIRIQASDNILKNAKSAVVPNTGNLKGIGAAAAAGVVAGDAGRVLEVLAGVREGARRKITTFLDSAVVEVDSLRSEFAFDLIVSVFSGGSSALVQISGYHTNIILIQKDGCVIYRNQDCDDLEVLPQTDRSTMTVHGICEFAESVEISSVEDILQRQIDFNTAIAREGLRGDWGANVGSVLLEAGGADVQVRAKALAASASDARMSGCDLPVVIVSGSGNQGLTASIPVIEYARELGVDQKTLYRALVVASLVTVHLKTGIGSLSAYCGAVSAGVGAGAGIAWLYGGRLEEVAHTIVNTLAMASGMICDGAKPSCAAKIALAVEAGILGFHMYQNGQQFYAGDGIIQKGVENTIKNVGRLARAGMRETDREIIRMMLN